VATPGVPPLARSWKHSGVDRGGCFTLGMPYLGRTESLKMAVGDLNLQPCPYEALTRPLRVGRCLILRGRERCSL